MGLCGLSTGELVRFGFSGYVLGETGARAPVPSLFHSAPRAAETLPIPNRPVAGSCFGDGITAENPGKRGYAPLQLVTGAEKS